MELSKALKLANYICLHWKHMAFLAIV